MAFVCIFCFFAFLAILMSAPNFLSGGSQEVPQKLLLKDKSTPSAAFLLVCFFGKESSSLIFGYKGDIASWDLS